jgi:HK97 family phage major capsid protein
MTRPAANSTREELEAILRARGNHSGIRPQSLTDRVFRTEDRLNLRDEAAADLRDGIRPAGRTLAARVLNSAGYRSAAAEHRTASVSFGVPVATARETADLLRLRTVISPADTGAGLVHEDPRERFIQTQPRPARVLDFIRIIPLDAPIVHRTTTGSYLGNAAGTAYSAAYPELTNLDVTDEEILLRPFPFAASASRGNMNDAGYFADVVDKVFRTELPKSLERDLLTGDGTSDVVHATPLGFTHLGLPTLAYTAGARADTIAQAVETVQDADFYAEPLAVVASPSTLRKIRTDKASTGGSYLRLADAVPDVTAWVPSTAMPAGTAIVGAFGTAVLFIHGDLVLEATGSHSDYFARGLVALKVEPVIAFRAPQTAAFVEVTGL